MTESSLQPKVAVVIEDDPDVRTLLDEVFRAAGFEVVPTESGLDGLAAVEKHQPVITTLDINLPGIDGFEVARRIRKISSTYIVMLSALAEESDVVLGLGSGADEYLVKPFRPRELRARIEALMRRPRFEDNMSADRLSANPGSPVSAARSAAPSAAVLVAAPPVVRPDDDVAEWQSHRDIRLNLATHTVLIAEREADLTRTEFDLLATLLESKRRVRSKSDLALVLRGEDLGLSFYVGEPDKRAIEAHIANLRRKIGDNPVEPSYIETVRGVGYRLTPSTNTRGSLNG
ncbi:chemotaxis protein CheY [Microbacterium sp. CH12i]|uniref:response regulator transcription factor n=1 Tax=Microbacterium sp. CH12i TaxID=1479651 RepID=UPI0004614A20|nr:response regulator transcription factor [Microbacterium sp. CH12i]KDA04877.1 chemotaxis protein CheY [Microbacterium sp. CH12i]